MLRLASAPLDSALIFLTWIQFLTNQYMSLCSEQNEDITAALKWQPEWKTLTSLRDALVKVFLDQNNQLPQHDWFREPTGNACPKAAAVGLLLGIWNVLFQYALLL